MKRFGVLALLTIFLTLGLSARNIYSRDVKDLPSMAQNTLEQNFKAKVSVIKIDKGLTGISEYEVILTDGTEISFDRDGYWTDVEVGKNNKVPDSLVPKAILDYVKTNNGGKKVIGIEKDRNTYEIQIENGKQLKFDRAGNFLRYED